MQSAAPLKLPMNPHVKLIFDKGDVMPDPRPYSTCCKAHLSHTHMT